MVNLRKFTCLFLSAILLIGGSTIFSNAKMIEWTDWIPQDEAPKVYYEVGETRTEYRSRHKSTTTSFEPSLPGYIKDGYNLVDATTGSISYVSSFPSGFEKSHWLYSKYNQSPANAFENDRQKLVVNSTDIQGYIYWHWCLNNYAYGPINRGINGCWDPHFPGFHAFETSSALGFTDWAKAYQGSRGDICTDTYWWYGSVTDSDSQLPIYRQTYTTYNKKYNYYKWSKWSEWSTQEIARSDSVEVQTRITRQYRITPNEKDKQKIIVKSTSYTKAYGAKAFFIDAKTSGDGIISYKTNNKKVATVTSRGKVFVKGCGKATIRVNVSETKKYKAASKKITVVVNPTKLKIKSFSGNKKALKVTYVKQNNADGYKCTYNRGKKKMTTTSKKGYVTLKNLRKGTCIVRIRAYKKISNKRVYGKYGKIKFLIN